jgi:hypothetical protein
MIQWKSRFVCAPEGAGKIIALAVVVSLSLMSVGALRAQESKAAASPPKGAAAPEEAVGAHKYLEMPIDPPSLRGWRRMISGLESSLAAHAKNVTHGDEPLGDGAAFDKLFSNQLFPQFTIYTVDEKVKGAGQTSVLIEDPDEDDKQYKREHQSRLPIMRQVVISQFFNPCKDKPTYDHLAGLAVASMREIALKDYHPLARCNAVLLLAAIPESSGSKAPYPATWKVFVECLASDSSVVKVAAMNAILKHAKAGVPPDQQAALTDNLEKILADKNVGKAETHEAHDWTRRKAIEVLLALGEPAANAKVVADLVGILSDQQSSVDLCCAAAKALGTIRSAALGAIDLSSAAANVGRAAVVAARAELEQGEFRAFLAPLPVQNPQGGNNFAGRVPAATPDAADAGAAPAPPPVQTFINVAMLRGQLNGLMTAFKGPGGGLAAAAAGGPSEQKATAIQDGITALMGSCDPKATDYAALKQKLEAATVALEAKLGNGVSPAAPVSGGKSAAKGADPFDSSDKAAAPAAKPGGAK